MEQLQRESAETFIKSQALEGWLCLATSYDDGGFSGGNADRPALQRLLTDSKAGLVRACGMEAGSKSQHRTRVNPQEGFRAWASVPSNTTPGIRRWPGSSEGGSGEKLLNLTPGDLLGGTPVERRGDKLSKFEYRIARKGLVRPSPSTDRWASRS